MIEWPMLVISGMLGSAHCLGMCGPFALVIGSAAPGWRVNLRRQVAYSAGRIFTYAVLGATAGFVATRLARSLPAWTNVPAVLAILAGVLLVWQGLLAAGVIRHRGVDGTAGCPGGTAFRALLAARGLGDVFLAGLFTGLLPCGLLYGMLAYAASRHDPLQGLATMVAFGAGTVPAMVAAGLGGSALSVGSRRRVHALAAWCLVATGIVSIARGTSFVSLPGQPAAGCPFCEAPADGTTADVIPVP
ncbi:MAG: sulfite exporter TauE/SafE family protein [Planctomycetia bacterium]|nr:sulfite exporter TauE/SafE family protein [Planctomycetia bacterium]